MGATNCCAAFCKASHAHASPQFNFLKPTHSMFSFFTALADAYSKVLMPSKSLAQRLHRDAEDKAAVLDRCLRRLEWERSQERCARMLPPFSSRHSEASVCVARLLFDSQVHAKRRRTRRRRSVMPWCAFSCCMPYDG